MTTAHAKLNLILDATAADSAIKARVRKAGFFSKLVMLAGCLVCKALGHPADTFVRMEAMDAAR